MVTDNLSERAEQLADAIGVSTWGIPRNRAIEKILSFAADSANLARGVALEQAAQHLRDCATTTRECLKESQDEEDSDLRDADLLDELALAILALAPDAAQALAAHDAKRDKRWINSLTNNGEGGTALTDHFKQAVAEIERRAREDEVKSMLSILLPMGISAPQHEKLKKRIAALAESQPAPATQPLGFEGDLQIYRGPHGKPLKYTGPAPATQALDVCGNCGHPIFAHGRNGCTQAECGCLGGEVRPAPAGVTQECEYCDSDEWKPRHFDKTFRAWWHAKTKDSDITMPCQIGWGEPHPQAPEETE